ncbi:hypothetical protein [Rhizobium mongolense]|uniref:Uncharacterized protein n=1 Tax=Rhizobium mongolense subsp. loessense TaxID=158890 RepID=A0A1G4QZ06_9HYPH|nr:hypothetical protein [Rhizobium mongolense]SCW49635.1 hypothetical protein SAMN02927900_02018 [Rhizobium mongolense subsp. loessense]
MNGDLQDPEPPKQPEKRWPLPFWLAWAALTLLIVLMIAIWGP